MSRFFSFVVGLGLGIYIGDRYDVKQLWAQIGDPDKVVQYVKEEEQKYRKKKE